MLTTLNQESTYLQLESYLIDTKNKESLTIKIPSEPNYPVGSFGFLFLFLSTLRSNSPNCEIAFDIGKNNQDFAPSYLNLIISALFWNKIKGNKLKIKLRENNQVVIKAFDDIEVLKSNNQFASFNFDHFGVENGLRKQYYESNGEFIDDLKNMNDYVDDIIQATSIAFPNRFNKAKKIKSDLSKVFLEALKNTDEWATSDLFKERIEPNARGVYMKLVIQNVNNLTKQMKGNWGLTKYFKHKLHKPENDLHKRIFLIEITFVDRGVGLASRFSGKEYKKLSIEEEANFIKQCLVKHNTSVTGSLEVKKGHGLDRILNTLNHKGFLWIRSGRLSVYRDLIDAPHPNNIKSADDIFLLDSKNGNSTYTEYPLVKGTMITMYYPVPLD